MRKRFPNSLILLSGLTVLCVLLISSCDLLNLGKDRPSKNMMIEEEIVVATESVPESGGTLTVASPGSEIDGLKIVVPPQAYPTDKTFTISTAKLSKHNLGANFNPITPLIIIDNGGDYSNNPMEVTIPIVLPDGYFAMAWFYDEMTGRLEGLPLISLSPGSITVSTRHFMSGSELRVSDAGLKAGRVPQSAAAKMVISSISESVLQGQTIINSGFTLGTDDWEFINFGSYLKPNGHCAGQSMSALWYYYEKKLNGEPGLFHLFDQLNDKTKPSFMWQDNGIGYRFASTIQKDFNFEGWINSLYMQSFIPSLVFNAFAAAILVTGEPQFVLIRNSGGQGGHAMIVYKVNFNEKKLYIADPNYPNNREITNGNESIRTIDYVNGNLKPYETGLSAGASSISMEQIGYIGKTAYIQWDQIGKRYLELKNGTIGDVVPNNFPAYKIWVKEKEEVELKDGFSIDHDTLRCVVECPTAELIFDVNGKKLIRFAIYDDTGKKIDTWEGNGKGYIKLAPGLNKIGFYVYARKPGAVDNNGNLKDLFIDFKWLNVYFSKLKIDPNPIVSEPGDEIAITAMSAGTAPKDAKYVWSFGDGSKQVTVKNDSIVKHKFGKEGNFDVAVDLFDNATNKLVGHATAVATIAKGILSRLQKFKYMSIDFNADINSNNSIVSFSALSIDNSPPYGSTVKCPIVWSGASFSVSFNYTWQLVSGETVNSTGTIAGTMSANGLIMNTLTAHETSFYPGDGSAYNYDITVNDVPYMPDYEYDEYSPRFGSEGPGVSKYIAAFNMRWDFTDSDGVAQSLRVVSVNYNDPEDVPYLHVTFSGSN